MPHRDKATIASAGNAAAMYFSDERQRGLISDLF